MDSNDKLASDSASAEASVGADSAESSVPIDAALSLSSGSFTAPSIMASVSCSVNSTGSVSATGSSDGMVSSPNVSVASNLTIASRTGDSTPISSLACTPSVVSCGLSSSLTAASSPGPSVTSVAGLWTFGDRSISSCMSPFTG